jgi:hypothetical protein
MTALGSKTNEPGIVDRFRINDTEFDMPQAGGYVVEDPLQQTLFASMAGGGTITMPYRGAGLPDRCDLFKFTIPYDLDDTNGLMGDHVELLRATYGPHFFTDWKQRFCIYTLRVGQVFAYLPREDAFGKWAGASAAEMAVDGTPATVVYKPTVAEADAVPAGEAWISRAIIRHPFSGLFVAPFKLGTAPGALATLIVKYFPVFRVDVNGVASTFPAPGVETKVLYLIEIN